MTNILSLKYPNKSHRKDVVLPKHSVDLAEFFGIMMGDGGINNPWQITITVNSVKIYKNIGLCFTSYSPGLISQVAEIFAESGIMPHISNSGRDIFLYQASSVAKYLKVFGTANDRIGSVYKKWRDARAVEWATLER